MTSRIGPGRLDGRVAVVTGAARGIGEAIAARLAAEGAAVLLADIDGDVAIEAASRLSRSGALAQVCAPALPVSRPSLICAARWKLGGDQP